MFSWKQLRCAHLVILTLNYLSAAESTCRYSLRLSVLEDRTYATPEIRNTISQLIGTIDKQYPKSQFSYSRFDDIPVPPFGCWGESICFEEIVPFTETLDEITTLMGQYLDSVIVGFNDLLSHTIALHNVLKKYNPRSGTGYNADTDTYVQNVILLFTDSYFHLEGDVAENIDSMHHWCNENQNQKCCPINGQSSTVVPFGNSQKCVENDLSTIKIGEYPNASTVFKSMAEKDVLLVVFVGPKSKNMWQTEFVTLANRVEVRALIVPYLAHSDTLMSQFKSGFEEQVSCFDAPRVIPGYGDHMLPAMGVASGSLLVALALVCTFYNERERDESKNVDHFPFSDQTPEREEVTKLDLELFS